MIEFTKQKEVFIILPAYNEAEVLAKVLEDLQANNFYNIILVNDGSTDQTAAIGQKYQINVVSHLINCGVGTATKTGIQVALYLKADIIVTFDADDQHTATDIIKMIEPIKKGKVDLVIGTRKSKDMPFWRRLANFIANIITWFLFKIWVNDSQSGLKAMSRSTAELIDIKTSGYEFSSEIIREIQQHNIKYQEIPISVKYSSYSQSKGQKNLFCAFKTLFKLLLRKIF